MIENAQLAQHICAQNQTLPQDLIQYIKQSLKSILRVLSEEWAMEKQEYDKQIQQLQNIIKQKDRHFQQITKQCEDLRNQKYKNNQTPYRVLEISQKIKQKNQQLNQYPSKKQLKPENEYTDDKQNQIRSKQPLWKQDHETLGYTPQFDDFQSQYKGSKNIQNKRYQHYENGQAQKIFQKLAVSDNLTKILSQKYLSNRLLGEINFDRYVPNKKLMDISTKLNSSLNKVNQKTNKSMSKLKTMNNNLNCMKSNCLSTTHLLNDKYDRQNMQSEAQRKIFKKICRKPTLSFKNILQLKREGQEFVQKNSYSLVNQNNEEPSKISKKLRGFNCTIR